MQIVRLATACVALLLVSNLIPASLAHAQGPQLFSSCDDGLQPEPTIRIMRQYFMSEMKVWHEDARLNLNNLVGLSIDAFGVEGEEVTEELAKGIVKWLKTRNPLFGNLSPYDIALMNDPAGLVAVINYLGRYQYGVFN